MCGFCGKLNFDRGEAVGRPLLQRMMDAISHRGPDGDGEYRQGPIGLGHRRLSIIDLNTGDQPMCNEDGTVWVVYNGEIYNFVALRGELEARGHRFKSSGDTEVILHAYEEFGPAVVAKLQGMFAFALWDERRQVLMLARDRVGIKPLYYANTGKAMVFGSEVKAILADPAVPRGINASALDRCVRYYYTPGPETVFKGVYKLEPGHYLTVRDGRVASHQYWDLTFPRQRGRCDFDESVEALRSVLRRTVRDHLISDVPVGVLLSGGVDSTGILSFAVEQTEKPVHTFTIGFSGEEFADERAHARMASRRLGTVHAEMSISGRDFLDFLPRYVWHMEEPVCEPPAVALYYVSRLARQASIKVLLSGEGGDEAFGGYQTYRNMLLLERMKAVLGPAKGVLRKGLEALDRVGWHRAGPYIGLVDLPVEQYYLSRSATPFTEFNKIRRSLYTEEFAEAVADGRGDEVTRRLFKRVDDQPLLNQMLYVDTKTWLPDDLLIKADRMTMATSVELRVPLLDSQVLEFAAAQPESFKVLGWSTKRLLKAVLKSHVPDEILSRKKTGFPVPYVRWLRTELKDFVVDTLSSGGAAVTEYFRKEGIQELLSNFYRDGVGGKEVFCLVLFELWHRRFLNEPSSDLVVR